MKVVALGYLGFTTTGPLDEWAQFATEVLGASAEMHGDRLRIRVDDRNYRIEVTRAQKVGVSHIGWDVGNDVNFARLRESLASAGVEVQPASRKESEEKGVLDYLSCHDPAGNKIELFYGQVSPKAQFVSPQGTNFVTGEL